MNLKHLIFIILAVLIAHPAFAALQPPRVHPFDDPIKNFQYVYDLCVKQDNRNN